MITMHMPAMYPPGACGPRGADGSQGPTGPRGYEPPKATPPKVKRIPAIDDILDEMVAKAPMTVRSARPADITIGGLNMYLRPRMVLKTGRSTPKSTAFLDNIPGPP